MTTKPMKTTSEEKKEEVLTCGIVMPISSIDSCTAEHWKDVYKVLCEAISGANFKPRIVSESEESGIIQKKIIQNLYDDPIVVVDVSGKNPNVMFELGLRLAFDKPTIIVKDDKTDYSFDTSPIEHLAYPRDLRYQSIIEFKEKLKEKVIATYTKANTSVDYSTFLKHFGTFKVAKLDETVVGKEEFILKSIEDLRDELRINTNRNRSRVDLSEEATQILVVENRIKDFVLQNGLSSVYDVQNLKLEEECFTYLENFRDVRRACGNAASIKRLITSITEEPPF